MNNEMHPHNSNENSTTNNPNIDDSILSQQPSSPEELKEKQLNKFLIILGSILGFLNCVSGLFLTFFPFFVSTFSFDNKVSLSSCGVIATVLGIILIHMVLKKSKSERKKEEESYFDHYKNSVIQSTSSISAASTTTAGLTTTSIEKKTALDRMLVDLEAMRNYYNWSQDQAKKVLRMTIGFCIAGLLLFAAAAILPIVFKSDSFVSICATVGGGLTELFAGTAFIVYRSSVSQLNYYHKALHEDERFLSCIDLVDKISTPEAKDKILKDLIKSQIQMNIVDHESAQEETNENSQQ